MLGFWGQPGKKTVPIRQRIQVSWAPKSFSQFSLKSAYAACLKIKHQLRKKDTVKKKAQEEQRR